MKIPYEADASGEWAADPSHPRINWPTFRLPDWPFFRLPFPEGPNNFNIRYQGS